MTDQRTLPGFGAHRDTLAEARREVEHGRIDGVVCPCCGQFAKVYRRRLNRSMALALLALERGARARNPDDGSCGEWVHLFDFLGRSGIQHSDAPTLRCWGLIEGRGDVREDGNPCAGFYRITLKGRLHARCPHLVMPKHALIFNNELLGFSEEGTTLREALGKGFSYDELMAAPGLP